MSDYLKHPIVIGAVSGAVGAARADFKAFREWKSFDDATRYDWKTAAFRVFQGAVIGAVMGTGLSL